MAATRRKSRPRASEASRKARQKEEHFCQQYVIDFNGTRAAIDSGWAKKSAHVTASRLLKKPKIQARIRELTEERARRLEGTADDAERRLWEIANVPLRELFDEHNQLRPVHELPERVQQIVSGIEFTTVIVGEGQERIPTEVRKIKLPDRLKALELILRRQGAFTEKHEHDVRITVNTGVPRAPDGEEAPDAES